MIMILDAIYYKSVALKVRRQLREKKAALPVMQSPELITWFRNTYDHLEDGQKLFTAAGGRPGLWMSDLANQNIGNQEEVRRLLSNRNIDIDWQDGFGRTPLGAAVFDGNAEIVTLLLDAGADTTPVETNKMGANLIAGKMVPLLVAVGNGNKMIVELLLKAKANPNIGYSGDRSMALDRTEDPAIKELLIRYGARSGR
jgi:hypothetical protein